jgi:hypothetical protein
MAPVTLSFTTLAASIFGEMFQVFSTRRHGRLLYSHENEQGLIPLQTTTNDCNQGMKKKLHLGMPKAVSEAGIQVL